MKKLSLLTILSIVLLANDDYVPLNNLTSEQKENYNFIKKKDIQSDSVSPSPSEFIPVSEYKKTEIIQENNQNQQILQKQNVVERKIDKKIINDYQKENILKNSKNKSTRVFNEDFSITPKVSYMHVTTTYNGDNIDKTHEVLPEISFRYQNHIIKSDYFGVSGKNDKEHSKYNLHWYRIAYLYSYLNAKFGIAYNDVRNKVSGAGWTVKEKEKFATLELHFENSLDDIVVNYGGFYGKNDHYIKNAYEYYLTLGYRPLKNDNLVLNLGYKNRTIEKKDKGDTEKYEFKGPIVGISSTF